MQHFIFPTIAGAREAFAGKLPTLALVDWNMPDGTGSAFCRWIRSHWKDLPVIFITVFPAKASLAPAIVGKMETL